MNNSEFQERTGQIEHLVQQASALSDEGARTLALDLLQAVMDLHGKVLSRMVELLTSDGESGHISLDLLGRDPLICGLLVLYGAHPLTIQERIAQALERIQPQLAKHGYSANLMGVADGQVVQVKAFHSENKPGAASAAGLKETIEQALLEAAPEASEIVVDGLPLANSGFVPLSMLQTTSREVKKEHNHEESAARH